MASADIVIASTELKTLHVYIPGQRLQAEELGFTPSAKTDNKSQEQSADSNDSDGNEIKYFEDFEPTFCKAARESSNAKKWIFEWMHDLVENSKQKLTQDYEYEYTASSSDDKVSNIRTTLAHLQTQMPAWTTLHEIASVAQRYAECIKRCLASMEAAKRKSRQAPKSEVKQDLEVPGKFVHQRRSLQKLESLLNETEFRDSRVAEAIVQRKIVVKEFLTGFVAFHVMKLLEILYKHIDDTVEMLEILYMDDTADERAKEKVKDEASTFGELFSKLYKQEDEKGEKPWVMLVGPVGERPLHVCSLLAAVFKSNYDFEGQGNYVSDGIIEGMREFLQVRGKEAFVPYGKDYCAAMGNWIMRNTPTPEEADCPIEVPFLNELTRWCGYGATEKSSEYPFHQELTKWCKLHGYGKNAHQKMVITCGLYEGETILYPRIASGDADTVRWLLENEKPWDKFSLTEIHAKGLFFRPMHQQWLATASLRSTWSLYRYRRVQESNLHASSPKSYFGLSVLAFAASQGGTEIFEIIFRAIGRRLQWQLLQVINQKGPVEDDNIDKSSPKKVVDGKTGKETKESAHVKNQKGKDDNFDKSSPKKFAEGEIFEQTEKLAHHFLRQKFKESGLMIQGHSPFKQKVMDMGGFPDAVRSIVLNMHDEFGNTLLHLAAWNDKRDMYSKLIELGADTRIENNDGLSAFTLTARFGIWGMFKHIWDKHLTTIVWMFGNVTASNIDYSQFDWHRMGSFQRIGEIDASIDLLVLLYLLENPNKAKSLLAEEEEDDPEQSKQPPTAGNDQNLNQNHADVMMTNKRRAKLMRSKLGLLCERFLRIHYAKRFTGRQELDESGGELKKTNLQWFREKLFGCLFGCSLGQRVVQSEHERQFMSAARLITLYRPKGWYAHTHEQVQEVIMRKWSRGYYLVYIGDSLLPYMWQVAIFSFMWSQRELHILEHNFWWSESTVRGYYPEADNNPDSACGIQSIWSSASGRLQFVMLVYSVPSLLNLARKHCRLRPTDLDENEDLVISFDEIINFVYLNLESIFEIIISALFIAIITARISAGEECAEWALRYEKAFTAIAALFLFTNLFVVFKLVRGIGLLLLSTYRFFMKEIFGFLIMYCIYFTAFLLALQTLHNANHYYLRWLQDTDTIVPRIREAEPLTYLVGQNMPGDAHTLNATQTALDGCQDEIISLYETAFALLEVSMGDGLADSLLHTRTYTFQCAGLHKDTLVGYILILWVLLTNILVLNILIAAMSSTFSDQMRQVGAVWLLDVSYRIMRYEFEMPELTARVQLKGHHYNFWTSTYWISLGWDIALVIYCLPEVKYLGLRQVLMALYTWASGSKRRFKRLLPNTKVDEDKAKADEDKAKLKKGWKTCLLSVDKQLSEIVDDAIKCKLVSELHARAITGTKDLGKTIADSMWTGGRSSTSFGVGGASIRRRKSVIDNLVHMQRQSNSAASPDEVMARDRLKILIDHLEQRRAAYLDECMAATSSAISQPEDPTAAPTAGHG